MIYTLVTRTYRFRLFKNNQTTIDTFYYTATVKLDKHTFVTVDLFKLITKVVINVMHFKTKLTAREISINAKTQT